MSAKAAGSAVQSGKTLPKGGIDALNISRIQDLLPGKQGSNLLDRSQQTTDPDAAGSALLCPFDRLCQSKLRTQPAARLSSLARRLGDGKGLGKSVPVGFPVLGDAPQGSRLRTRLDAPGEFLEKAGVTGAS